MTEVNPSIPNTPEPPAQPKKSNTVLNATLIGVPTVLIPLVIWFGLVVDLNPEATKHGPDPRPSNPVPTLDPGKKADLHKPVAPANTSGTSGNSGADFIPRPRTTWKTIKNDLGRMPNEIDIAKYINLLNEALESLDPDHPDRVNIPSDISGLKDFFGKMKDSGRFKKGLKTAFQNLADQKKNLADVTKPLGDAHNWDKKLEKVKEQRGENFTMHPLEASGPICAIWERRLDHIFHHGGLASKPDEVKTLIKWIDDVLSRVKPEHKAELKKVLLKSRINSALPSTDSWYRN